jgi:hypothetical protein
MAEVVVALGAGSIGQEIAWSAPESASFWAG